MRSILFSILFVFIPKLAISQVSANDKTIYLDSLGKETSRGQHKFYRITKDYYSDQKEYKIYDYFKNNVLKREATQSGKDGGTFIGKEINYYENGNIQTVGNYENRRLRGKFLKYYENGNLKEEGEYNYDEEADKHYKINQYWDENKNHTIIDGNGAYSGSNKNYYEKGTYNNGFKDGIFEAKNLKDNSTIVEKYDNGTFISGIRTFADNTKTEYFEMEKPAKPIRGMQDFYAFIGNNFNRTSASIKNNISGKMYIKFIIEKDGQIVEPTIIRGLGYGLDEEAIRVVLKYEKWIPAEQRGAKARQTFTLPFTLQSSM